MWNFIASLHGLQQLYVRIAVDLPLIYQTHIWRVEEKQAFIPIRAVKTPKEFEVLLPYMVDESKTIGADASSYACRFRRVQEALCPEPLALRR